MSRRKIVVLGSGPLARMVGGILSADDSVELVGFTDADRERHGEVLCGRPVLGGDELLADLRRQGVTHALIGAGIPALRARLARVLEELGFELATAVHRMAYVAPEVILGRGVIVLPGVVLADNPVIGENVFVGQAATIAHDSQIERDCLIGGRSAISAEVHVGAASLVGWGAIVGPRRRIGAGAVVGSGANVVSDVPAGGVMVGNPARLVKTRDSG